MSIRDEMRQDDEDRRAMIEERGIKRPSMMYPSVTYRTVRVLSISESGYEHSEFVLLSCGCRWLLEKGTYHVGGDAECFCQGENE